MKISLFEYQEVPLTIFGLHGPFWTLHIDTLMYTWAAMFFLFLIALMGSIALRKKWAMVLIAFETILGFFINLTNESFGSFKYKYFSFITTIFLFTFFCCVVGLIPFLDESTKDLNTTFALGLTSFLYVQYEKIRVGGIVDYFKEFLSPFFLLAPINVVGEVAKVASMSFRLFGNILGGSIIFGMLIGFLTQYQEQYLLATWGMIVVLLVFYGIPRISSNKYIKFIMEGLLIVLFLLTWMQAFFGFFEGLIQSFVLTMLTSTYLSMGVVSADSQAQSSKEVAS